MNKRKTGKKNMKLLLIILMFLACASITNAQVVNESDSVSITVVPVDPNAKKDNIDDYLIVAINGKKLSGIFKNEKLFFADSVQLHNYIDKNVERIDNKVDIKFDKDSDPKLYSTVTRIFQYNKIYSVKLLYQEE